MQDFALRPVFFVRDTPQAMEFYTNTLGFTLDWTHEEHGRPHVVQVSLLGMQIILNQTEVPARDRPPGPGCEAGHGRIFIGLDDAQTAALFQHVRDKAILPAYTHWGAPTLVISDLDRNELYFWLSDSERIKWREAHAGNS